MAYTTYGPGDSETWGAPTGHPHDPRTEEWDDEYTEDDARSEVLRQPYSVLYPLSEHEGPSMDGAPILTAKQIRAVIENPDAACGPSLLSALVQDIEPMTDRDVRAVVSALREWVLENNRETVRDLVNERAPNESEDDE